jgi:hypothetical protein
MDIYTHNFYYYSKSRLSHGLKYGALNWDGKSLTELRADFTINSYKAHRSTAKQS